MVGYSGIVMFFCRVKTDNLFVTVNVVVSGAKVIINIQTYKENALFSV